MSFKVNFTDVQTNNFEALPAGVYHVRATDGEVRESGPNSKNPGSEYINWELTVQEGPYEGRKLWTNTSLLPQALFALKGMLEASGRFTDDQLSGDLDFEIDDVLGAEFKVKVTQREYNGDTQNDIKRFYRLEDGPAAAVQPASSSLLP